jgi:hypothetical protein
MVNLEKIALSPTQAGTGAPDNYSWVGCFYQMNENKKIILPLNYLKSLFEISNKSYFMNRIPLNSSLNDLFSNIDSNRLYVLNSDIINGQIKENFKAYEIFVDKDIYSVVMQKIIEKHRNYDPDKSLIL